MTGFVVSRQPFCTDQDGADTGSRVPLAWFPTRAAADRHLADLFAAARRVLNPFEAHGTDEPRADALAGLGVAFSAPPAVNQWGSLNDPAAWYDAEMPHLSDAERAKVWGLFTERPLYEVAELELVEE